MTLWRVDVKIKHPKEGTQREWGFYPAPDSEAAIDFAKWCDTLYPPVPPFTEQTRTYSARPATGLERDAYLSEVESVG
jgi:hypothetical protein